MTAQSTVRSRATGLARKGIHLAILLAVATLPLLSMGITVPAAMAIRDARAEDASEVQRLDERDAFARRLAPYVEGSKVEDLQVVAAQLHDLIPTRLRALDEFGEVRSVAANRGVRLASLRRTRTHHTGLTGIAPGGTPYSVVVDEVVIAIRSPLETTFGLVDDIRAHGLPAVVLGFDVARPNVIESTFQTELRLGFLRRVPRVSNGMDTGSIE